MIVFSISAMKRVNSFNTYFSGIDGVCALTVDMMLGRLATTEAALFRFQEFYRYHIGQNRAELSSMCCGVGLNQQQWDKKLYFVRSVLFLILLFYVRVNIFSDNDY